MKPTYLTTTFTTVATNTKNSVLRRSYIDLIKEKMLFLALIFCFCGTVQAQTKIVSGSIENTSNVKSDKYQIFNNWLTWNEAKVYCESIGGHLATITSKEELTNILSLLEGHTAMGFYWVGGTETVEGEWKWITREKWEYTNWDVENGEPNQYEGNEEDYLQLYNYYDWSTRGTWNDLPVTGGTYAGSSFGFICEWNTPAIYSIYPNNVFNNEIYSDITVFAYSIAEGSKIELINETNSIKPVSILEIKGNHIKARFSWKNKPLGLYDVILISPNNDTLKLEKGFTLQDINMSLNNGLVAYYPFNGNSNDESGNDNNGIATGGTLTSDRFGMDNNAYSFDGVDDKITVKNSKSLNFQNDFSVSFWVKTNGLNSKAQCGFLSQLEWNKEVGWAFGDNGQYYSKVLFRVLPGAPESEVSFDRKLINDNIWHHIVGVRKSGTNYLYLDNKLISSYTSTFNFSTENLLIGEFRGSTNGGIMDDIRIYNRPLSEEELYLLYNPEKNSISSYSTHKVGNYGKSSIVFEGNGFNERTTIKLAKAGQDTIVSDTLNINLHKCQALFDFNKKANGKWDILVYFGDFLVKIKEGLEIEDYQTPKVTIQLIGPGSVRPGRYTYYTIHYKNEGNVNVYQTPVFIRLISQSNVPVITDWIYRELPFDPVSNGPAESDYSSTSTDPITGKVTKFYAPTIPLIPPGGEGSLIFGVNMTRPTEINANVGAPMYYSDQNGEIVPNQAFYDCMANLFEMGKTKLIDKGIDMFGVPGVACLKSAGETIVENDELISQNNLDLPVVGNVIANVAFAAGDCGFDIVPELKPFAPLWELYKLNFDDDLKGTISSCSDALLQGILARIVTSIDPNDKIGYRSPSGSNFFSKQQNFTYLINFENKSTATAPAQEVFITDTLDLNSFDISSFKAGYLRIGSKIVQAPVNAKENKWEVDMRPTLNLITTVELTLDTIKGIARWYFSCYDPKTNDFPADALVGFLPPNDSIGSGEGSVSFTIDLKETIKDESLVKNRAAIVFDNNDPILTPTWSNRKDLIAPASNMFDPEIVSNNMAALSWEGKDNQNGSGVYCYNLFMKKGNDEFTPLLTRTSKTYVDFAFEKEVKYSFYVTAVDSAENAEVKTNVPEVTLFEKENGVESFSLLSDETLKIIPNPNNGNFIVQTSFEGESQLTITSLTGQRIYGPVDFIGKIQAQLTGVPKGIYLCNVQNSQGVQTRKIEVK